MYHPYTAEEVLDAMDRKNISKILMVGDSLSRFMWGDIEDLFSQCTQKWLLDNPVVFFNETNSAAFRRTSWDNALSGAGGFGVYSNITGQCNHQTGIVPLHRCCQANSCRKRNGKVRIHQFLPGFMGPAQKELIMPARKRSVYEWEAIFTPYIVEEYPDLPNVVVFNAGLWLVGSYHSDAPKEIETILTAWMNICKRYGVLFVWRSTFYHHRSTTTNRLVTLVNNAAIKMLLLKYQHPFFLDSNYIMSLSRPDRTVDGFHYNYRMLRSSWIRCTPQDFEMLDANCVRDTSWPMSVGKAATLNLLNLLLND
jgi:hypothetical protein